MTHFINLDTWHRKDQYELFLHYEQPFFNVCAHVDVTEAVKMCNEQKRSFFLSTLFAAIDTANHYEPMRYRIENNKVRVYAQLDASCTVLNKDHSFSFCDFGYSPQLSLFIEQGQRKISAHKAGQKSLDPQPSKNNVVHFSVLPWLHFTSFSNPSPIPRQDSIPKIVMGKYQAYGDKILMPVSVDVHHSLMDGLHVGEYFAQLQATLNRLDSL
ncbi:CatA-like O-acetyltransferase [Flocculibacter collagenilyticus]|uniref:CatA-like O-acetyltransferase n=1 Tax=Flocculibacter collagenilyticus TaxID=2744479 RepID=UPI0018F6AA3E|nr:CatA-like O-acetyltransferase [Flocculibacter collagenilyticus]